MIADDRGVDSVSRKNRPVFLESLEASAMSSAKLPLAIGLWNQMLVHEVQKVATSPWKDNVTNKSVLIWEACFDMPFLRIPQ